MPTAEPSGTSVPEAPLFDEYTFGRAFDGTIAPIPMAAWARCDG